MNFRKFYGTAAVSLGHHGLARVCRLCPCLPCARTKPKPAPVYPYLATNLLGAHMAAHAAFALCLGLSPSTHGVLHAHVLTQNQHTKI